VLACAGCSVRTQQHATVRDDTDVPFALLDRGSPSLLPPTTSTTSRPVGLCFVRQGKLVPVTAAMESPVELTDVVDALASPPAEVDGSLRTAVGQPRLVAEARLVGGVARVDLVPAVARLGSEEQLLAIGQLVCSLTSQPGVGPVSFTLDGTPIDVPRGDGSLTSGPVSRDDYQELME
jgi:spore germination protein GerM